MRKEFDRFPLKKRNILIAILIISLIIIFFGFSIYKNQEISLKQEKFNLIKGIAQLKINQLSEWYTDELNDSELITLHYRQNYFLPVNITDKPKRIEKFLLEVKSEHGYDELFIVNSSSEILYTTNNTYLALDSITKSLITQSVENNKSVSTDIYLCKLHNELQLDFIVPVTDEKNEVIQLMIFRIDPEKFLFPLVSNWPTPSKTSETLLLRKDGDQVLFLNELRHQKNTALKLRIPLTKKEVPAVQAILGNEGIFEGKDYRGVKVLSYTAKVPNTPWYMVAKVDQSEIYADLYFRTAVIITAVIFTIILISLILLFYHNHKKKNLYQELYLAEEIYKTTLQSIGDAVITTDVSGKVIYLNSVAEEMTGWKLSEAKSKRLEDVFVIIDEFTREKVDNPVQQILEKGIVVGLANHTLLISKTGSEIPIADSGAPIRDEYGNIIGVVLVFRNQTKERETQKEIYHLNRLYKTLSESNQAIVKTKSRDSLFEQICKISVEYGEFRLAWIGLFDKEKDRIIPHIWYGDEKGFLSEDYLLAPKDKLDLMPCYRAFKGNRTIPINDIQNNPDCEFWKDAAIQRNIYSMAAAPIKLNDEIIGVYVLYSSEKNFFGIKELNLVEEVAADLSFAINSILIEENKKLTELKLKESEETYRNLFQNAQVGLFRTRISDGKILESNTKLAEMFGYSNREEFINEFSTSENYVDSGTRERMLALIKENGFVQNFEARFYRKDKSIFWARYSARIYPDKDWIEGVVEDVTQLKEFENALIESEKKFRLMAENAQDLIYRYEFYPYRGFTYVSPSATAITGYTPEEHYNDPDLGFKIVLPEDRHLLQSIAAGEEIIKKPITLRWMRKDGKIIWTEQKNIPIYNNNGELIAIEGIARDVTNIKLTEIELIKSEERYRSIYENALVGIYRTTPDGKILLANPALLKMLGYNSLDELLERNLNELDYEPEYSREEFIKMLCEKDVIESIDSVWTKKDGSKIFVRESVKVIKDSQNNPLYFEGIVQDITENKRAQELLISERLLLRTVIDNLPVAIYTKDKNCRKVLANKMDLKNLGASNEIEVIGKTDYDFFSKEEADQFYRDDKRVIENGEMILNKEESFIDKSGKLTWLLTSKIPLRNPKGEIEGILGISIDITERKKIQEELILAKEKAEESDKLKSEFLAQMSHEIRTPLHIITSSLGLVEEDLANTLAEEDLELFTNIKISAKRIMRTINLILNMSELHIGAYKPNYKEIDLEKNVLIPLINEHKNLANEKKLDLRLSFNAAKRIVYADEYSLTQIFANLIDNAIKYTLQGKIEVSVYDEDVNKIIVEVKDTGIGMTEDFMKNLFKPFMQEEHGLSRSYDGNGLGLSLVKKYCELNNAIIDVRSKKNVGTTFTITLNCFN